MFFPLKLKTEDHEEDGEDDKSIDFHEDLEGELSLESSYKNLTFSK